MENGFMEIVSRAEAKESGLEYYWNGKPCKWNHKSKRKTSNGNCMECERIRYNPEERAKRKINPDYVPVNFEKHTLKSKKYSGHPLSDIIASRYKLMVERGTEEYWKERPSYKGTSVCDLWRNDYDAFFEWFLENYVSLDDQIDKDIIGRHMHPKVYSPETCLMVPKEVNNALWMYPKSPTFPEKRYMGGYSKKSYESTKGKGVSVYYKSTFQVEGKTKTLGQFKTEYEAHCAWRGYKIDRFIQLSKKYTEDYPKMADELKSIALEMSIDAAMDRPTEWPHG